MATPKQNRKPPVDTGKLRPSITFNPYDGKVRIVTRIPYIVEAPQWGIQSPDDKNPATPPGESEARDDD